MTIFLCFFAYCWLAVMFARHTRSSINQGLLWDLLDVFWPLTIMLGLYVIFFTPLFTAERTKIARAWRK